MAETFLYLTSNGRKTGKPHNIEIWYVQHAGCYYLCSEKRDNADWVRNIQQQASVTFHVAEQGQSVPEIRGQATIVVDEVLERELRALFAKKYKWSNGLFVAICPQE